MMQVSHFPAPLSFSWDIHYSCNYRCPYCWWVGNWQNLAQLNCYLTVDEWVKHWQNIHSKYGTAQIEIIGGEPFIYPDFVTLIEKLSALHTIRITTNLSTNIDAFVKLINPSRVKVNPTFHPVFAEFNAFMEKCVALRDKGFTENVNYLAYPPQIGLMPSYKVKFNQKGLTLTVMTFWGEYNGKDYPASYTEEERWIISAALGKRNNQEFQLTPKKMVKGKLCAAGHRYAVIQTDGTVLRCGGSGLNEKMGNFFDENFSLQDKPSLCNSEYCKCNEWAELLEDEENNKETITAIIDRKNEEIDVPIPIPNYPRAAYPYKVHWNWEPTYDCNYRCSYCTVWREHVGEKIDYLSVESWKGIWDKLFDDYGSSHIRFSGGEPFIYPHFMELINVLSEKNTIDITTNLSFGLERLLDNVKSGCISISGSFHPDHVDFQEFIKKILYLNQNGFPSAIAYVAYPPYLEDLQKYKSICEEYKILFKIIPFNGEYENRKYPAGYSEKEKRLLEDSVKNTKDAYQRDLNEQWYLQNLNKENEKGKICRMGQMYAKIHPNGKVTRCCAYQSKTLGNIFNGTLRLLDVPEDCDVQCECPCFKAMLVNAPDEKKMLSFWQTPPHHAYKTEYYELIAQHLELNSSP